MTIVAGTLLNIKRLSREVKDESAKTAIFEIENKLIEIDKRLIDIERRLKAGGL